MADELLMPRQGNTVESCIILEWKKNEGDPVSEGEPVCEVETDKATFEVEATAAGTLLKRFFNEGDDVPVLTTIAVIGSPGEDISSLGPEGSGRKQDDTEKSSGTEPGAEGGSPSAVPEAAPAASGTGDIRVSQRKDRGRIAISPRAKKLAELKSLEYSGIAGTGPDGRIIERDVKYVLASRAPLTPAAMVSGMHEGREAPAVGSGIGGRVLAADLAAGTGTGEPAVQPPSETTEVPVKGIRKIIAERMHASLSTTAQLTMSASADARSILAYRKKCKNAPEERGLSRITINDVMLYAVSRLLTRHPFMNAHFLDDRIVRFGEVNLGFAVDTERGLMVPVIKHADRLSLKGISREADRLSTECIEGKIQPDSLTGGTFTVTNLGALGIESFTPVLNAPEVGILGVCSIQPKPVMQDDETVFHPCIGLSLTINHQAVDGAPAARFLKELKEAVSQFELLLAE